MTSVTVRKLKGEELLRLWGQGKATCAAPPSLESLRSLEKSEHAYSVFVGGKLRMCAGVAEYWAGRGEAWAVFDQSCRSDFLMIHRAVMGFLNKCSVTRIEAGVDCDFEEGKRWVKLLGFKEEAPRLEAFLPNGKAAALYARVRQ